MAFSAAGAITIPGGTTPGLKRMRVVVQYNTIPAVGNADCGASMNYGQSYDFTVNVCDAVITAQPANNTACVTTGSAGLSLTATAYQWKYWNGAAWNNVVNGTPTGAVYTNATTNSVTIASISTAATYSYQCVVTGGGGCTITSATATLNILPGVPSTVSITSPANASVGYCPSGASAPTLNWTAATGTPAGYKLYFGTDVSATNIVNGTDQGAVLTYNPGALTANTTYYWKIVPTNSCGDATGAATWSFITGPTCPCVPASTSSAYGYNRGITMGSINNINAVYTAGGYADYTNLSTDVSIGNTYTITIDYSTNIYSDSRYIWVDWNQDGDFADANETMYSTAGLGDYSTTIVPPAGAASGYTRMRVAQWYSTTALTVSGASTGCGTASNGEIEDYTLNVCPVSISTQPANTSACVTSGSANLWVTASGATSYQWLYWTGAAWANVVNGTPVGAVYTNGAAATPTMTVSGISTVATYSYMCNAINGCSTPSNSASLTVISGIPSVAGISSPANGATALCPNGPTAATLNWTAATGSPAGYKLYFGTDPAATNIVNGTNLGLVLTYVPTLTRNTTYYWKIVPTNNCGDAAAPVIWSFTTGPLCFCTPTFTSNACTYSMYLSNFSTTGGSSNISVSPSCVTTPYYTDYTSQAVTVSAGNSFNVSMTDASGAYQLGYRIWIDLNDDGDFADAGEDIWTGAVAFSAAGSITIPGGTSLGTKRMRVIVQYNTIPGVTTADCGASMNYGQTYDFTVYVCDAVVTTQPSNASACINIGSANLGIIASGASTYQWKYWNGAAWNNVVNGTPAGAVYTNASTPTITIANISVAATYSYLCTTTGTGGCFSNSEAASLTITNSVPSNPTNSSETSVACNSFVANWTVSATAVTYRLDVSTSTGFGAGTFVTGYQDLNVGNVLTYPVTGLTPNTNYYYRVRAIDGCSQTSGFNAYQTAPTLGPLGSPTNSVATNITCNAFDGNWTSVAGAASYQIDVSLNTSFSPNLAGFNGLNVGNVLTYSVTALTPGTWHYYRVRAIDACGQPSGVAAYRSVFTLGPLAAPTNNVATNIATCQFNANWSSITNAVSYEIDVSTSTGFGAGTFVGGYQNFNVGNVNTIVIPGLSNNTNYYYRTRAVDACGQKSGVAAYRLVTTLNTAAIPTASAATAIGCSFFTANWSAVSAVGSYRLDVATNAGFSAFVPGYNDLNVGNVITYNVTGLTIGTTYFYRVRAVNPCQTSGNSGNITVTTTTLPQTNSLSTPANGAVNQCPNNTSTSLNWTASTAATSYLLYLGTNPSATNILNGVNVGNVLTYNPIPLSTNTLYYWKVVPINACGNGPTAGIRTFATGNLCYCVPPFTYDACPYGMYISNFNTNGGITNINNSTGCSSAGNSHYGNYSMQCVTAITGTSFNFNITKATSTYLVGARIWVDWNGDADFADAGEDVWNSGTTGSSFNGVINIPGGTTAKSTGMRVRVMYNAVPATGDYCSTLSYGETEDYCVTIVPVCATPTTPANSLSFASVGCTQMDVNWSNGNGTQRIVVVKEANAVAGTPTDNTTETADAIYGNGSTIAANEYVVYNGIGNNVTVSGLNSGTVYHYKVFEYNCNVGSEKYLTTSPPSNNQSTTVALLADAGKDQYLCIGTTVATMAGTGTGTWSQIGGAATTITTPASPITTTTGLASGTYVFRWSGICGYDDVVVIVE